MQHLFERLGIILEPTALPFEKQAVLNPSVIQAEDGLHMFYRAVDENFVSSIGHCILKSPTEVQSRDELPLIGPEYDYESAGIEDPRITKIEDTYYLLYAGYDGKNARVCYATSKNLRDWQKHGIISPNLSYAECEKLMNSQALKATYFMFSSYLTKNFGQDILLWEKDAFLLPRKINGQYAMIHRVLPDIQITYFDTFEQLKDDDFWRNWLTNLEKYVVLERSEWYETRNIGGGAPLIETEAGWLMIYHGVYELNRRKVYSIAAALFDRNDPQKLVGKFSEPLLLPETPWEISGDVHNVVFASGTYIEGNDLYIYYGAADSRIAVGRVKLDELLRALVSEGQLKR